MSSHYPISSSSETSWGDSTSPPHTPKRMSITTNIMAPETPNTLRRSSRVPVAKRDPDATVTPAPALRTPKRGPNPDSHDFTIQMLLKLPGFDFSDTAWVFPASQKDLAALLSAQYELDGHRKPIPAKNQKVVADRVADVIEACIDEWLDNWQDGPLLSAFWTNATERLRCKLLYWSRRTPSPSQVYKICMRYTAAWDPNGRGCTTEDDFWGFKLGDLTWGGNAARDFFEDVNDTKNDYGPIQAARGVKASTAGTNSRIRILAGSPVRATSRGDSEKRERFETTEEPPLQNSGVAGGAGAENVIIVYGPRRREDGDVKREKVKATVDLSVVGRVLVTFHNLDLKGKRKDKGTERTQEEEQDDEACDMDSDG
ncbi:hypothetical protein VMCG_03198 [Cytospora schulzeri]|uniref:Uncharacterized protein n=1 Tax=Cytospora schulzeri TaxID=448051 RepID=A0A423WXT2_9PEZI|nr:hypothetical protein VMCG_03198 [Valsa malicola]